MESLSEPDTMVGLPLAATEFRRFMRGWATGVAVVTSALAERPSGCTVNAFMSVSMDPPLLLVSLSRNSNTLAVVTASGGFAVNLLGWPQQQLATQFARAPQHRFDGVDYRLQDGQPVLAGVMAATVCTLVETVPVADHVLVIGGPRWCARTGRTDPVLLLDSRYQRAASRHDHG